MFELLISALKVVQPSLTDNQASNAIINLANWKQLQVLTNKSNKGKNEKTK